MKAYLANGLFSEADARYNEFLGTKIRKAIPGIELYIPQENAALNDKNAYANSTDIFHGDNSYLDQAELLIVVIDGVEIDSGVAAEIGRFTALYDCEIKQFGQSNKKIYALYTDVRLNGRNNTKKIDALIEDGTENQFVYRNLYAVGAIKSIGKIFNSSDMLFKHLVNNH